MARLADYFKGERHIFKNSLVQQQFVILKDIAQRTSQERHP